MISKFIGPAYVLQSLNAAHRLCDNMYLQSTEGEGKDAWIAVNREGEKLFLDIASLAPVGAQARQLYYSSRGVMWVVYGSAVIEITQNPSILSPVPYVAFKRLDIPSLSGRVSMTDNGKWLAIADGQTLRLINMDDYSVQTPNLPFTQPLVVTYLSQRMYCICGDPAPTTPDSTADGIKRNQIWWSDLGLDGPLTWDGLSYASTESNADPNIAMVVRQGDLVIYGPNSYEIWATSSNPKAPIAYQGGSASLIGCQAPNSVAVIGDQAFHLGSSKGGTGMVWVTNGYGMDRISNHAVEYKLRLAGDAALTAIGWAYQTLGHVFYVLTIPKQDGNENTGFTLVYDSTTNLWHTRSTRDPLTNERTAWTPIFGVYAFGRTIVANATDPVLLELDPFVYTDWAPITPATPDGTKPRVCTYSGPQLWEDLRLAKFYEFSIDWQAGVGTISGQGQNPQAMLRVSNDGGYTWSSERWTSIGKIGDYGYRCRWNLLGTGRMRVYEVTCSEPIFLCMIGARSIAEVGGNP